MRDYRKIIDALERKAADGVTPQPERELLLAKAAQLRAEHLPQPEPQPVFRPTGQARIRFGNAGLIVDVFSFTRTTDGVTVHFTGGNG